MNKLFSGASSVSGGIEAAPWGHWRGAGDPAPTEEEWVARIAAPSTPVGETVPWVKVIDRLEVIGAKARQRLPQIDAEINAMKIEREP